MKTINVSQACLTELCNALGVTNDRTRERVLSGAIDLDLGGIRATVHAATGSQTAVAQQLVAKMSGAQARDAGDDVADRLAAMLGRDQSPGHASA